MTLDRHPCPLMAMIAARPMHTNGPGLHRGHAAGDEWARGHILRCSESVAQRPSHGESEAVAAGAAWSHKGKKGSTLCAVDRIAGAPPALRAAARNGRSPQWAQMRPTTTYDIAEANRRRTRTSTHGELIARRASVGRPPATGRASLSKHPPPPRRPLAPRRRGPNTWCGPTPKRTATGAGCEKRRRTPRPHSRAGRGEQSA